MTNPTGGGRQGKKSEASGDHLFAFLTGRALSARLLRSPENRSYARVSVEGRHEIYRIDSAAFREWLIEGCISHQLHIPSEAMIQHVVSSVEIRAMQSRSSAPVFLRVGGIGDDAGSTFFVDLGDASGRVVKIRADGWSVVNRSGVQFRRPEGILPLPVPSRKGSIELLRPYVNLTESHFRRAIVWLAAALLPCGPHPVLVIRGDEGSARSTLTRVLKLLIDPHFRPILTEHESATDLMSTWLDTWLPAYDDVSLMSPWLSKSLSELVRGRGLAIDTVATARKGTTTLCDRPMILSGVESVTDQFKQGPLCIHLQLRPILFDDRRGEREFWSSFQADYPRILAGILDVLTEGLELVQSDRRPA
jgi:hypothetical protein